jgi:Flp pilus assembly protein TadB
MTESELHRRWQSATAAAPVMSLQYLRHRMQTLQRRARTRNRTEYVGCALGVGAIVWALTRIDSAALQIAGIATLVGCLYSLWKWQRFARVGSIEEAARVGDGLSAYRQELERQHAVRHNNWRWYIAPSLPGVITWLAISVAQNPANLFIYACVVVLTTLWLVLAMSADARAARHLQQEIDALDTLRGE